jgi:anaphase-promoting complex subunit 8
MCRGKVEKSRNVLTESVRRYPCNWSAWKALNSVCSEWEDVISLTLPDHVMRDMFLAVMCLELHWCGEALSRMEKLSEVFPRSRFLILKAACAHYNSQENG